MGKLDCDGTGPSEFSVKPDDERADPIGVDPYQSGAK